MGDKSSMVGQGRSQETQRRPYVEAGVAGQAPWGHGSQAEKWALRATTIIRRGDRRADEPQGENYPLSSMREGRKVSRQSSWSLSWAGWPGLRGVRRGRTQRYGHRGSQVSSDMGR